ncbi:MAG: serine hydrolase [Acidobacteriota bacterium]|nr:serine hydrolase [Acidobacteriota bacterium]
MKQRGTRWGRMSAILGIAVIGNLVAAPTFGADAAEARQRLSTLDELVVEAVESWQVPGLAIAIVADGEVVHAQGYGFRDVAERRPMTPDTLFAIGSTTKAMTSTLLGQLVDDGKLAWHEPVTTYLPGFRLSDRSISDRLTPVDLVTHRSGLPRHDALWYNNNENTRAELVARLAHLELTADLRQRFQYNNLMYMTAGHLIEMLTGETWEANMRTRLFEPLGMERSNLSVLTSQQDDNHALPYRQDDDNRPELIDFRRIDLIGPAGSVNSSVREMAKWLLFNLNEGKVADRQVVQSATLAEIHSPQMTIEGRPERADISSATYGMGWRIDNYRGHRRLAHGGGIDGFITSVMFFPDQDMGVVSFTNTRSNLGQLVNQHAADRILGLDLVDWSGEALENQNKAAAAADVAEAAKDSQRRAGTRPSHGLADYPGAYEHAGYGVMRIGAGEGGGLLLAYNGMESPLEHWHFDVWNATGDDFEDQKFLFRTDVEGNVSAVEALMEPRASPVVFARQVDARLYDEAHLGHFVGTYKLASGRSVRIELSGGSLAAVLGATRYTLDPALDGRFVLREAKTIRIGFEADGSGRATKALVHQPDGVYEAPRAD